MQQKIGTDSRGPLGASFPLLEREQEIGALEGALEAAFAGNGRFLLINGPAGAGKSRLLAEARGRASEAGALALEVRCLPLEQEFSFRVALGLYESALAERDERERRELFSGAARVASTLFESFRSGAGAAEEESTRFPLLHGLFWLTANLSARTPLLLAVDDAHWADISSLRFLLFLAQRLEGLPVALIVALRDGEAGDEHAALLNQLASIDTAQRLTPSPLSRGAVGELVNGAMPGAARRFCDACAKATEGNPFLVGELLQELLAEGVRPTAGAAGRVERVAPESLRRAILLRLAPLAAGAIELAKAVAILGDDAELRHAAAMAELDREDAAEAADALAAAGILRVGDRLRFVHPLIASALYAEVPPATRGRRHRRAAELLASEGARAERRAAHLLQASREADPRTVGVLREAAREALRRGSPESAASYLKRALDEPPVEDPVAPLLELGHAQTLAGSATDAVATLERGIERAGTAAERARLLHARGAAELALGRLEAACDSFERGADAAADVDDELALRIEADLFSAGLLVPDRAAAVIERTQTAVGEARRRPPSAGRRAVLALGGLVSVLLGEPREHAIALAEEAVDGGRLIAEEGADGTTLYSITGVMSCCGEPDRGIELLDEAIEAARRAGSVMGFATASYCRAEPWLQRGAIAEAVADARAAIEARRHGWGQYLPPAYSVLIRALIELDQLDQARAALAEVEDADWEADASWTLLLQARGLLSLAEGNPESALADFEAWGQRWPVPNPAFYCEWRSSAAVAATGLGDRERAVALAEEELAMVERFGAPRSRGIALRALGIARGGAEGIETLERSVEILAETEVELEHCRAIIALGAALRRERRRADARETLKRALAVAERIGATALHRRASEELKLAGGRSRGRSQTGVDSLSPGELRVARMAAEGMTNRQIAQALFVTPKAVQWHLSNTYRKLEIGSREEIAGKLEERAAV